jgi:hypothetical protein
MDGFFEILYPFLSIIIIIIILMNYELKDKFYIESFLNP